MSFLSRLEQLEQIRGSLNYHDTVTDFPLAEAESHGKLKASHGDGSVLTASPTTFTDSVNSPFSLQNIGDFIRIPSGANSGTYRITAFIDADNVTLDGATFTDESGITYQVRQFQNTEDDFNYIRTQLKEMLGATVSDWFGNIPTYTNPKATNVPRRADLSNLSGKTLDAHVRLIPIESEGESVSASDTEITLADTTQYADATDKTGLPVADTGELDETNYRATIATLIDPETGSVIKAGGSGAVVFGRMIKGSEGTNFKVKFFTGNNDGTATPYTWDAADPTSINVTYWNRKTMDDVPEDVHKRRFVLGMNEDAEVGQDIDDLQSFTGGADGETRPTWANITGTFALDGDPDNLEQAVNDINDAVGSRQYSALANNCVTDGDTITKSIEDLAEKLSDTTVEKITEIITTTIPAGTPHTLPGGKTYTLDGGNNGLYMDIILNQGHLNADKAAQTVDYEETSTTSVTFHGTIHANAQRPAVLAYKIRKHG